MTVLDVLEERGLKGRFLVALNFETLHALVESFFIGILTGVTLFDKSKLDLSLASFRGKRE